MGHSAEFGYVHWARVQNLLMHHWATEHIIDHSIESHYLHLQTCLILQRNGEAKNCTINCATYAYTAHARNKILLCAVGHCAQWNLNPNISVNSKSNLKWLQDMRQRLRWGLLVEKKPQVKNLFRKSLLSEYRNICTELCKHAAFTFFIATKCMKWFIYSISPNNICLESVWIIGLFVLNFWQTGTCDAGLYKKNVDSSFILLGFEVLKQPILNSYQFSCLLDGCWCWR